jgi:release factor glutamine methyltransferase
MKNLRSKWQDEVFAVYEKIKKEKKPYIIKMDGLYITVMPNVFSPKYFTDSLWFAKKIKKIVKNKSLLEVGTGTGIVALFAGISGAKVVVTDINKDAVKNAKLNFKKYKINTIVRCGDIYKPIKKTERFDFIFWNHPFNNWGKPVRDVLLKAGFDYKYKSLSKYISGAKEHLLPKGRLLIGTGGFADLIRMKELAKKNNYKIKVLEKISVPLEDGIKSKIKNEYIILEFTQNN